MNTKVMAIVKVTILFTMLLVIEFKAYGQEATPSPTPAAPEAVSINAKGADENASQGAAASPAPFT